MAYWIISAFIVAIAIVAAVAYMMSKCDNLTPEERCGFICSRMLLPELCKLVDHRSVGVVEILGEPLPYTTSTFVEIDPLATPKDINLEYIRAKAIELANEIKGDRIVIGLGRVDGVSFAQLQNTSIQFQCLGQTIDKNLLHKVTVNYGQIS
ncbi:MAG: hypothetical protein J0H49_10730 [Acidobacteria bacterium]|nr:hypothetical protein [Acidobacteriota bacterium]